MKRTLLFIPIILMSIFLAIIFRPIKAPVLLPEPPAQETQTQAAPSEAEIQTPAKPKPVVLTAIQKRAIKLASQAKNLDPKIVELALTAHQVAKARGLVKKPYLAVIDYSKRSVEKRLWIYDLAHNKLLYELYVSHGEGSGKDLATRFSNIKDSRQTSLGVFTTGETYEGMYGLSLRLDGREPGFNNNARKRSIIMHGADFAREDYIKKHGVLGTSWACPTVSDEISDELIELLKNGSLIFAYYPDKQWLNSSTFLNE